MVTVRDPRSPEELYASLSRDVNPTVDVEPPVDVIAENGASIAAAEEQRFAEERARIEAERRAAEEAALRLAEEQARLEAEERAARIEAERRAEEEARAAAEAKAEALEAERIAHAAALAQAEQKALEVARQEAERVAAEAAQRQMEQLEEARAEFERRRAEEADQRRAEEEARRLAEERAAEMEAAREAESAARAAVEARLTEITERHDAEEQARRQAEEAAERDRGEARAAEERAMAEEARRLAEEARTEAQALVDEARAAAEQAKAEAAAAREEAARALVEAEEAAAQARATEDDQRTAELQAVAEAEAQAHAAERMRLAEERAVLELELSSLKEELAARSEMDEDAPAEPELAESVAELTEAVAATAAEESARRAAEEVAREEALDLARQSAERLARAEAAALAALVEAPRLERERAARRKRADEKAAAAERAAVREAKRAARAERARVRQEEAEAALVQAQLELDAHHALGAEMAGLDAAGVEADEAAAAAPEAAVVEADETDEAESDVAATDQVVEALSASETESVAVEVVESAGGVEAEVVVAEAASETELVAVEVVESAGGVEAEVVVAEAASEVDVVESEAVESEAGVEAEGVEAVAESASDVDVVESEEGVEADVVVAESEAGVEAEVVEAVAESASDVDVVESEAGVEAEVVVAESASETELVAVEVVESEAVVEAEGVEAESASEVAAMDQVVEALSASEVDVVESEAGVEAEVVEAEAASEVAVVVVEEAVAEVEQAPVDDEALEDADAEVEAEPLAAAVDADGAASLPGISEDDLESDFDEAAYLAAVSTEAAFEALWAEDADEESAEPVAPSEPRRRRWWRRKRAEAMVEPDAPPAAVVDEIEPAPPVASIPSAEEIEVSSMPEFPTVPLLYAPDHSRDASDLSDRPGDEVSHEATVAAELVVDLRDAATIDEELHDWMVAPVVDEGKAVSGSWWRRLLGRSSPASDDTAVQAPVATLDVVKVIEPEVSAPWQAVSDGGRAESESDDSDDSWVWDDDLDEDAGEAAQADAGVADGGPPFTVDDELVSSLEDVEQNDDMIEHSADETVGRADEPVDDVVDSWWEDGDSTADTTDFGTDLEPPALSSPEVERSQPEAGPVPDMAPEATLFDEGTADDRSGDDVAGDDGTEDAADAVITDDSPLDESLLVAAGADAQDGGDEASSDEAVVSETFRPDEADVTGEAADPTVAATLPADDAMSDLDTPGEDTPTAELDHATSDPDTPGEDTPTAELDDAMDVDDDAWLAAFEEFTAEEYLQASTREHVGLAEAMAEAAEEQPELLALSADIPGLESGLVGLQDVVEAHHDELDHTPVFERSSDLGIRIATGLGLLGLFLGALFWGTLATQMLVAVVLILAVGEMYVALKRAGFNPVTIVGLLGTIGALAGTAAWGLQSVPAALGLSAVGVLLVYAMAPGRVDPLTNSAVTLLGVAWIGGMGAFAIAFVESPDFRWLVLATVLVAAIMDVASYFGGRAFGRHPLAPSVSPKKTIEGLVFGVFFAIVTGAAFGFMGPFDLGSGLALGAAIAVAAPFGDLAVSVLKRGLGVKDIGVLLPGHGGILDRIDAILFAVPAAWLVFYWTGILG